MTSFVLDKEKEENKKRFQQALYKSKGKTNNTFAYDLISNSDATTEEVVRLGTKLGNMNYYEQYIVHSDSFYKQRMHDIMKQKKISMDNFTKLTDYKWLLPNAKMEDIDDEPAPRIVYDNVVDIVKQTVNCILDTSKETGYEGYELLSYKALTDVVYGSDYFDKEFVKRVDDDTLGNWHTKMRNEYLKFSLDDQKNHNNKHNYIYNIHNADKCSRRDIKQILELCNKIAYSELIMWSYLELDQNTTSLADVYTKKNVRDWGDTKKVQNYVLELMKVEGTYRILLTMGVGMCADGWRYARKRDMARVHARVRAMYKNFVKSKTVEQREATRSLMVEQLNLIAHDFGHNRYEFKTLACTEWQDKKFEDNLKNKKENKNAKGLPKGTKIDISKLKLD